MMPKVVAVVDVRNCFRSELIELNLLTLCNVRTAAYTCNDNIPWAVNDNLAYGFAAASISGKSEGDWCCACYELTFNSGPVSGKKMVVQVTNTGGDLGVIEEKNS